MAWQILLIAALIVLERFVSRSDTKALEEEENSSIRPEPFFDQDEIFKRTKSMSQIQVKTFKTMDVNTQNISSQRFLE